MRKIFLLIIFIAFSAHAQKLITKTGVVTFDGSVVSFEAVSAKNDAVTCVFKPSNGQIASLILVKGFKFKTALMEEHFNENYVESSKYPKATLRGKLIDFNLNDISELKREYMLSGKLELHGVQKNVLIKVFVSKKADFINIESDFTLSAADFEIVIPSFVRSKVTDIIKVNTNFLLN